MVIRCGVDIVDVRRFEKNLEDSRFLEKVFHASELKDSDKNRLAGIFALKEATMKALGRKVDWKDIEVRRVGDKPEIVLSEDVKPSGFIGIDGSVSHDGGTEENSNLSSVPATFKDRQKVSGFTVAVVIIELG